MAEANGIRDLPKQDVQSILEGFSIDDSERSLPQVPNETLGLSSVSQTLSSSFNRLRRGITNRIGKHTSQPQDQTSKEINVDLGGTSYSTLMCSSQCRVRQQPYAKTTLHKIRNIYTMHKKSPHAYKIISLDVVIILKHFSARIL